jgi:signal transduction histidine kinase
MPNRLRRLLAPPIFEDEEKTRISQFMTTFSWIAIGILFLMLISRLALRTDATIVPTLILIIVILLLFLMQHLLRLGHVYISSIFVVFGLWGLMTYLAWRADGLRDMAVIAYFVIIILCSLLLGWRSALVLTVMSIVTIWVFAILEKQGTRILHVDDPISFARDLTGIIFLVGALIYLLVTGWSRTLQSARLELQERLRAEEKLQRQAGYLNALNETALGLLNRFELHPLLESILIRACDLIDTKHGLIELVLPDGSALRQELGCGVLAQYDGTFTFKDEGVTGCVWSSGEPLIVGDYHIWDKGLPDFIDAGFHAVMGMPLKVGNAVIGVLAVCYIEEDRTFTQEQVDFMERFAALAALAIDNVRLYEQAQKEIHERSVVEVALRAILASIPDMIFEISKDGTFLDFMASAEITPVMPPMQFIGKNIKESFPLAIAQQTLFALERALATGQLHAFEYGLPPGEETQFFEARVSAISPESAIIMVRDISQRKWIETEREKLINELEQTNGELERFTYTVSHDLKSPLITIKGFLGFLEQDAASGNIVRLKSDIKRIADATDKMQLLLNDLLELSRIGRVTNPYQYIQFKELAREVVEFVHGRLYEKNIQVLIQDDLPNVYGDRQRLFEVLQNLVDNAAKFTGTQTKPLIEIGHKGFEDGKPILYVKDNGMGIDLVHQDRIFGLFNKLDANSEGTGIGLALVKRIIEVHRGRIWVESEVGSGSTFFFTLPAGPES